MDARAPGKQTRVERVYGSAVQRRSSGRAAPSPDAVHAIAAQGVTGSGSALPHQAQIQASFGKHDISGIDAHIGGEAATAASQIGAEAYATGTAVAFRDTPDLFTAAHEAAHVVQQQAGVSLLGGVGQASDRYENHANQVAERVVRGESAESLLDAFAGGSGGGAGVQRKAVQRLDGERERGRAEEELGRRTSGTGQADGSGAWGAEADDRGVTDRANHYMWTRVALAAETMGLTNAARHMRHYLGNTGTPLTVNVDAMLRDVAPLRQAFETQVAAAQVAANQRVTQLGGTSAGHQNFQLTGPRMSDVYCSRSVSSDWYFAIGGFTYWYTADVTVLPGSGGGPPTVQMHFVMNIFDRYNWDQGKAVEIAGITIRDEQLGRLHRVGLAQEYDVNGTSSPRDVTWTYAPATAPASTTVPTANDRDGARSDPGRERGRHFDNVRGSPGSNR